MVMTEGKPVVFVFLYIRYPASCASCARMIDRRLFRSRNSHAALYLASENVRNRYPREEVRTSSDMVMNKVVGAVLFRAEIFQWIRP